MPPVSQVTATDCVVFFSPEGSLSHWSHTRGFKSPENSKKKRKKFVTNDGMIEPVQQPKALFELT